MIYIFFLLKYKLFWKMNLNIKGNFIIDFVWICDVVEFRNELFLYNIDEFVYCFDFVVEVFFYVFWLIVFDLFLNSYYFMIFLIWWMIFIFRC